MALQSSILLNMPTCKISTKFERYKQSAWAETDHTYGKDMSIKGHNTKTFISNAACRHYSSMTYSSFIRFVLSPFIPLKPDILKFFLHPRKLDVHKVDSITRQITHLRREYVRWRHSCIMVKEVLQGNP